jgi:aspartyl protease family protein
MLRELKKNVNIYLDDAYKEVRRLEWGRVLYLTIILAFAILFIARSGISKHNIVKFIGLWAMFVLTLFVGYSYRYDLQDAWYRVYANLVPGTAIQNDSEIIILADRSGHFFIVAEMEGVAIKFLIDTGATTVSLTWEDAMRLGMKPEQLSYTMKTETANGTSWAAPITLQYIQIGNIRIQNISASVTQQGNLSTSLLGMSFLEKLEGYRVSNNTMTLLGRTN